MKKNFLFGALALMLAGFWFGGASLADGCTTGTTQTDDHVASITVSETTTYYCSLREAVDEAEPGATITLLKDDHTSFTGDNLKIDIKKNLTIDGGKHTIYGNSNVNTDAHPYHWIYVGTATPTLVTIKDLTIDGFADQSNRISTEILPLVVASSFNGKVVLSGLTFQNFHRQAINIGGGEFEISNVKIIGKHYEQHPFQQGIEIWKSAHGTIDGVEISGIENKPEDETQAWDAYAIVVSDGDVEITNTTISNSDNGLVLIGSGDVTLGAGNNFSAKNDVLLLDEGISGELKIKGGIFSVNPETSGYVDTGYYAKDNGDGTWTVEAQTEISTIEITGVVDPVAGAEPFTGFTVTTGVVLNSTWTGEDDAAFDNFSAGSGYTLTIEISADTGYILSGGYTVTLNGEPVTQTANKVSKTYKGKFKVTFDGGNEVLATSGDTVSAPTVSKECNSLDGWYNGDEKVTFPLTVTGNLALTSKWTYTCSRSSGGGGGSSRTTTTSKDDTKATTGDNKTVDTAKVDEQKADETKANEENKAEEKAPMTDAQAVAKFGQEQIDAYKWALENGITTMKTVEEARLDQPLTRAELAKMMVVYVAKVLEKQPITTGDVSYQDVDANKLGDLAGYIKLAYQYQIMGINADGTPIDFFNPNGIVSRGEYATVFSRVLFGSLFNKEGEDFYTNHLKALEAAGILSNTEPTIQEMRGWVMLMMYRSSKNTDKIAEVISTLGASEQEAADAQSKAEEEKVAEAPEVDATTGDVAEVPEAEATTGDVAETPAEATTGDVAETPAEASTGDTASN